MTRYLNAFPIDVSKFEVAIYDISPQPTTPDGTGSTSLKKT